MIKPRTTYITLLIATIAVSWAAILFKLSGAEPLPAAFYRLFIAVVILAIPALPKFIKSWPVLTHKDKWLLLFSGLALGLHFATWVTSLFFTTIANSALIVSTNPVWVLVLEAVFLKSKIKRSAIIGMIIALAGIVIISQTDISLESDYLIGDLLALIGAILAAVYLLLGRILRAKIDNLSYIFPVYLIAAITLLLISLVYGENLTVYPAKTWFYFLLLAIVPTILGHSLYNWLLKYIQAHIIAITILGEPVGTIILAMIILHQIPSLWAILGGILILIGIYIVLKKRRFA
ncbi:MAG: DMT family transporter [Candidatus Zixiibacteriota bacterium]